MLTGWSEINVYVKYLFVLENSANELLLRVQYMDEKSIETRILRRNAKFNTLIINTVYFHREY